MPIVPKRRAALLGLLGAALLWPALLAGAAQAQPAPRLSVEGEPQLVYRYAADRCDPQSIPDSPARAYRRPDGSIALIAAHFQNRMMFGRDFDSLRLDCRHVSRGAESDDPSRFDDRYWIQAFYPLPDGRVLGLASNEFAGRRHRACQAGQGRPECWYMAITALVAQPGDMQFSLLPRQNRVVAAAPSRFTTETGRTGFSTVSNIVTADDAGRHDGRGRWIHFIGWTEDSSGPGGRGNCLFRAERANPLGGWSVLSGGRYLPMADAYEGDGRSPPPGCDKIGQRGLRGKVRSVVWLEQQRLWLAVYATRNVDLPGQKGATGVFYATSPDLQSWSEPALLAPFEPFWGRTACGEFYEYPSVIDHASRDTTFETVGQAPYLYLTRANWQDCRRGMNRDLVRYRLRLQ